MGEGVSEVSEEDQDQDPPTTTHEASKNKSKMFPCPVCAKPQPNRLVLAAHLNGKHLKAIKHRCTVSSIMKE